MSGKSEYRAPNRSGREAGELEDAVIDPYDKSVVDLETIANAIYVGAAQDYSWQNYYRLQGQGVNEAEAGLIIALGLDEQRHGDAIACMQDRSETALEKTVASQAAHIRQLANFYAHEPDERMKAAYAYILADHLTHHRQYSHKLSQKEGLSPLAEAGFAARVGRAIEKQFIEPARALKRPYDRENAAAITKVHARLVLAQELAARAAFQALTYFCGDKHLIMLFRRSSIVDNLHIAMVQAMIDPRETPLERAYLTELAEVVSVERGFKTSPAGPIREIFARMLAEEKSHLAKVGGLMTEGNERSPQSLAQPWPALEAGGDIDSLVARVARSGLKVSSRAERRRQAA